ncbi:MAG: phosphoglycerate kinase [Candidatus Woesebacteria bacterium]|jgi:phosphoglycerate kinase
MNVRKLSKIPKDKLKDRKIFVRCDMDVPFDTEGNITSTFRIDRCLETIKYLLANDCSVILATKIGRPEKRRISTDKLLPYLKEVLSMDVAFAGGYFEGEVQKKIKKLHGGGVLLLENVRFYEEEKDDDSPFVSDYAKLFDIFVNEAFAMSHRREASITGFPKHIPSYAGFNLEQEIDQLERLMRNPAKPFVFLVGGVKVGSKLSVIDSLRKNVTDVLIGGRLVLEEEIKKYKGRESVVIGGLTDDTFDIDDETLKAFKELISKAKTILWAGPMGKFEEKAHQKGTKEVVDAITSSDAYKVAGGGDTIAAIEELTSIERFDFVSTGGGAMLAFLSGKKLKALESLKT